MIPATAALFALVATATPREIVQSGNQKLRTLLKKKQVKSAEIMKGVEEWVDLGELARRSLGAAWQERSPKERTEFVAAMKEVLRAGYEKIAREQLKAEMTFDSEDVDGDEATVKGAVEAKKERLPLAYRLFKADATWKVYDLVVDDSSLLEQYQSSFRREIAKSGFPALLKKLKAKQAELDPREKAPPPAAPR